MRATHVTGRLAATALAAIASVTLVPSAHASNLGTELNGTYRVVSNGDWARTNDVKIKQPTVVETWTITSSCVSPIECSGEVKSDLGWTAPLRLDAFYYVERIVPNWIPCPNGTFAEGFQMFILRGVDPTTEQTVFTDIQRLSGRNVTKGPSGACGVNKPVVIELPVSITKLS